MAENNQDKTMQEQEPTSQSDGYPLIGQHDKSYVPHHISNHNRVVQTSVMVNGEWININDVNDQLNVEKDLHKVGKAVVVAQQGIVDAQNAAESAVKSADSAISASKVNSDAIAAQGEAISEAKKALDSVATEIQLTASSAASDAASIRADVAKVESEVASAKSASQDSVNALQSDIDAAKKDLADAHSGLLNAQAAIDQNKKLINDSVAKINNDIAQNRNDLAAAQQANADTAKKLDGYTKQAIEQGKSIEELQTDGNSMKLTIADIKGNVSQVQGSVTGLTANLKDANDNLATVKALADSLSSTLTDHGKNIASLQATAKELSSTLGDADGRLSKVEQTAKEQSTTLSNVQGSLSQVKQTADGLTDTLKDAQGNIDKVRATAKGLSEQITNAQGDITALQTDVTDIKATIADHDKNIHTLQADSKSLHDDMEDAQGNISKLQKTATSLDSEFKDHNGRISKVEQTANTLTNEFADQQGHLNRVEQTAQGTQQTVANQQGQINNIKTDAAGIHETITGQGNQIANINVTLSGLNSKYEGVSGDLNNLKSQAQWVTVTSAVDLNNVKTPCHEFLKGTVTNAPNEVAWWYLTVEGSDSGRITQTVIADLSNNRYTRRFADSWSAWVRDATQTDVTALSNRITTNSTQITQNKKEIDLKADQSTVNNLSGEVSQNKAQLKVQADQISSKVSSEDFKTLDGKVGGAIAQIQKNSTAIDQTNQQISLKADQTEVNNIKNMATQNSSRLNVMANEISSKVTSTDVNNIVDKRGYATTSTVQSLITQKAGTINESITNLTNEMNTRNGVNLLKGTKDFSGSWHNDGSTNFWHTENWIDPNGNHSVKSDSLSWYGYYQPTYLDTGDYTFSGYYYSEGGKPVFCYMRPNSGDNLVEVSYNSNLDSTPNGWRWFVVHFKVTKAGNAAVRLESGQNQILHIASYKLERGTVANPVWTPAPSDNATVTQVQSLTASIDGLQSTVANKADKSQITQLSNVIQSKVSASDFNNLRKAVDLQTLESADANNLKTNGHYFVHNLANNPVGGWVYVDVTGNGADRIRQDVYQDSGNQHKYRRWFGNSWTNWSEGATESEITQLRDDINLRVKSGDLLSQINIQAGHTLIQSNKIYFDADSFVMSPNSKAFIPAAFITNLTADQIATGTLKSIQIDNGDGKFTVNPNGDVVANSIKLRNGQFLQGTIAGSTIYALNNNGSQDSKLAPKSDWYKITPNMIRWFNHYDRSVGQIGVGQGVMTEGDSSFTGTPGLTISDSAKILLGTAQRTIVTGDEIGNLETTGLDWMSKTNLEISVDLLRVNLDPDQGNEDNGKGAEFAIQKDNKIGAYFGSGDNGNELSITTFGDNNHITFNTGYFNVSGEVNIPDNGLTVKDLHVTHWLGVDGSKNSIVRTSQGTVAINAYETAEYYFGDIGEGQTNSNGIAYIGIEKLFNETVNTTIPYHVFITAYGPGNIWVDQREHNRFVVKSDQPNLKFSWEIKAKRKGYEHTRLQNVDDELNHMETTS